MFEIIIYCSIIEHTNYFIVKRQIHMILIKFTIYLIMFLINEILNYKIYISNFFYRIKLIKSFKDCLFGSKNNEIFQNKFINKYIKINKKNFQKKIISEKKIVVESLINHPHYLIPSC